MVDITHKNNTLRKAIASAIVTVSKPETIDMIISRSIPKGDVFEFSRVAGLFAVKKTSEVIPDCHPLPVEYTQIRHHIEGMTIKIEVEVHTIYRTGVEVEAMHGAAITALTMYDMLKPIDKGIEISSIKLETKTGGKSDIKLQVETPLKCAVIVCSDTISAGKNEDASGKLMVSKLEEMGCMVTQFDILPDEIDIIQSSAKQCSDNGIDLLVFIGGTGLSPRDVTPQAITSLIDIDVPGIMERLRSYGQDRMPYAMFSRGVAGFIKDTLVITLPGSQGAVKDALDAIFPHVFHLFKVRNGYRHE
jgi:cyclic pyranopterin monophosphate synthase